MARRFQREGQLDRWLRLRRESHEEVCRKGYEPDLGAFVQCYGGKALDASLLQLPLVGFLPATDVRVRSTVKAIERRLMVDGFVRRYDPVAAQDGLPPDEGAFLACSFWLVDNRSEEHTSELQSLMRIPYAVFCLKKTKRKQHPKKQ